MKTLRRMDFEELVQEVRQAQSGRTNVSIWGGRCAEGDLLAFLQAWSTPMEYRIWEYVSEIAFERAALPQNAALLERGRLFGEGGDLELRRDGPEFAWRFIGPAGAQPPKGNYGAQDYWASHSGEAFHQREETALLWGKWDGSRWADDRVGAARLEYPAPAGWPWVQIHYNTFSRAGRIKFVWYTGLSEWKEDDNG